MNIAITLNGTVRDLIGSMTIAHEKYLLSVADLNTHTVNDISETPLHQNRPDKHIIKKITYDLAPSILDIDEVDDLFGIAKKFKFSSLEDYNDFLYENHSIELFANAIMVNSNAMLELNKLYTILIEDGHNVTIVSQERKNSKLGTYFFLGKNKCYANNIKFVYNYGELWESYDMIITSNTYIIKNKPEDKICVKIDTEHNKNLITDTNFKQLSDLTEHYNKINNK